MGRSSISPPTLVCVHRASTQASLAALWSALATLYATFLAKFLTSRRILVSAGSGSRLILWTVSPAFRPQSAMLLVKFLTQLAMPVFVLLVSIATSILSLEHCLVSRTSFAMLSAKYSILQTTPVSALPALTATPIPSLAFSPAYPTLSATPLAQFSMSTPAFATRDSTLTSTQSVERSLASRTSYAVLLVKCLTSLPIRVSATLDSTATLILLLERSPVCRTSSAVRLVKYLTSLPMPVFAMLGSIQPSIQSAEP